MSNLKNFESVPLRTGVRRSAFTLIELLVVIAIIAILAAVLLPVLHQAQLRGETATCIDHQKQLITAWIMYANDNNDYCVGNKWQDEEGWNPPKRPTENWISGWMDPSGKSPSSGASLPSGDSDNTNSDLLVNPKYASLGDYTKNRLLFICPSSQIMVDSVPLGPRDWREVRSVSMNSFVGYVCSPSGDTTDYKIFNKMAAITAGIDTADLLVFIEERGESIDDGSFAVLQDDNHIFNWPTDYHNVAATLAFADGHVEVHRWFGMNTGTIDDISPQDPTPAAKWSTTQVPNTSTSLRDLRYLQKHTSIWISPGPAPY